MIKVTFTGDIIISPEQLSAIYNAKGKYDFDCIFENIRESFNDSDLLVGNLETPLAGEELGYTNHKWSFNTPASLAKSLKKNGFDILTTANNHCLDRGIEGLVKTIETLDKYSLGHTGTYRTVEERDNGYVCEINKVKIAFLSYTYGTNAVFNQCYLSKPIVNLFQEQERTPSKKIYIRVLRKLLRVTLVETLFKRVIGGLFSNRRYKKVITKDVHLLLEKGVDFIVMCMHAGGQYNSIPDVDTRNYVKFLLRKPIGLIIGNHPHVIHPAIKYNNKIGFYSLGDFCPYPGCASAEQATSGVYPEYSILVHLYINEDNPHRAYNVTFEILKAVIDLDGIAKVYSLFDLIQNETNILKRESLIADNQSIYNIVTNRKLFNVVPQKEYDL